MDELNISHFPPLPHPITTTVWYNYLCNGNFAELPWELSVSDANIRNMIVYYEFMVKHLRIFVMHF